MICKILVIFSAGTIFLVFGALIQGKARIDLETLLDCKDMVPLNTLYARIDRCNRTHRCLNGNYTVTHTVGSKSELQLVAARWTDAGWKPNAFVFKMPDACNAFKNLAGQFWLSLTKNLGYKGCPLRPGVYPLNNLYIDVVDSPIAIMSGKFNARILIVEGSKILNCKDHIFVITPVMRKKN